MSDKKPDAFEPKAEKEQIPSPGNAAPSPVVPTTREMKRLASFFEDEFRVNAEHRRMSGIDAMLERAALAAGMKYTAEQEAILKQSGIGKKNYRPLTKMKMRAVRAMLLDIIKQSGDKFYVLSPSPKPKIPKSARRKIVMQLAREIVAFFNERGIGMAQDPAAMEAWYTLRDHTLTMGNSDEG